MEYIANLNPILQGLIATLFTWFITALGAGVVFFFKKANKLVMDLMLGFGAGVMIAASFWSLLSPAITLCEELGKNSWLSPAIGFISGALFIVLADIIFSKLSFTDIIKNKAHNKESFRRSLLLTVAVTLHNIPEGMAVGVAFGCASLGIPNCDLISAILLAVGIGLQNFPEGVSVALPLRAEGLSTKKSFFYGQLSGFVEPIAGVLGVIAAIAIRSILPFMLSFSAGAMVAVVSSELIPEAAKQHKKLTTLGVSIGFMIMMVLDVALG
ncbi:MAG: ZIP family metal transporter [Oscillospiraceae bacterium]